ncbi:MAG: ABC transporter permease [Planctomycetia bacterium]|nr:ABC transporter permease [Planctomycetia bacterium]
MDMTSFFLPGLVITWFRTLWFVPLYALGALVLPALLWLVLKLGFPKIAAIAENTAKSVFQQPVFTVLVIIGVMAVLIFPFIPYNTLGEDVKILKSQGLTLIKVLGILLAVWSAGTSVSEEIEEKTALTLLSKPISRRQLVLGKFFGIVLGVALFFIIVSTVFMPTCAYKVVYDARETCNVEPESSACLESMITIIPGLSLSFMEVVMMTAIAVALSTRLPMVPNMTICVSIYALGHLIPLMVKSAIGQFAIVGFVGNFLAAILPVLSYYSLEAAVAGGAPISLEYLLWAALYAVLYSTVAMFVALILFEDRDLA